MHGAVKVDLLSSSRRDFGQNLATHMRMAGSARLRTSSSWPFAPLVSALAVLDRGQVLAVLTCRETKVRMDFRREQSIGGNFVTRDYGRTSLCEMHTQVGWCAAMFPRDIHAFRYVRKPQLRTEIRRCASYMNQGVPPFRIPLESKIEHSDLYPLWITLFSTNPPQPQLASILVCQVHSQLQLY
jgi:hypothetical protein